MVSLTAILVPTPASSAEDDTRADRRKVQKERARAAAQVDVLEASEAELERALRDLAANIRGQEGRASSARQAAGAAAEAAQRARAAEARAAAELTSLRNQMKAIAVESYVRGPSPHLAVAVEARSLNDLAQRRYYIALTATKGADMEDGLRAARQDVRAQREQAEAAEQQSAERERAVLAELRELEAARVTQARVAASVETRLEQTLAEVASLEAVDQQLAAQLAERQRRLAAQVAIRPTTAPTTTPPTTPPTTAATTPRLPPIGVTTVPKTAIATTTTTPTATAPTTTVPKTATPRPASAPPLTTVRGITVATTIASELESLLSAADEAGLRLSGGGYRSSDAQIETRRANCGPTDYDIYEKPASACDPPTARPGQSMHEQGLAIDFTSNGRLIQSQSDPAFTWLSRNASRFGLFNLPREPWHWSTNGN